MRKSVVYLGPSLPVAEAGDLVNVQIRPPVRRGDLNRVERDVTNVVIIDGEFGQSLSVTPKEILQLLDRGVTVWGAASMGALRAAELDSLGMQGFGWIYECYRSGFINADDEVALAYDPDTLKPLTVPLVNVRYWGEQLAAGGRLSPPDQSRLLRTAQRIFFADRTPTYLLRELKTAMGETCVGNLLAASGGMITDIKRHDAELVLANLRRGPVAHFSPAPKQNNQHHNPNEKVDQQEQIQRTC